MSIFVNKLKQSHIKCLYPLYEIKLRHAVQLKFEKASPGDWEAGQWLCKPWKVCTAELESPENHVKAGEYDGPTCSSSLGGRDRRCPEQADSRTRWICGLWFGLRTLYTKGKGRITEADSWHGPWASTSRSTQVSTCALTRSNMNIYTHMCTPTHIQHTKKKKMYPIHKT